MKICRLLALIGVYAAHTAHLDAASPTIMGSFTINNSYGGNFAVGQSWAVELTGGQPNVAFTICATKDYGTVICNPNFGNTDQSGNWKLSGSLDASTVGGLTEWLKFPSGAVSNRISFTIGNTTGQLSINNALGGAFPVGQPWALSLAGAPANTSFDICAEIEGTIIGCTPNFGASDQKGSWTTTGVFPDSAAGGWTLWLRFPSGNTNRISFTIGTVVSYLVYGIDFGPYLNGQDPTTGLVIGEAQIAERVSHIAPLTQWIRTYGSTNGLDLVGKVAHQFGLRVAAGIWLNNDISANERELSSALAAYNAGYVDMIIVGSEVLYRGDLTESQLINYLQRVKQAAPNTAVATADTYLMLLNHPNVVAASDVIFFNDFPYWDGRNIGLAVASLNADYQDLKSHYPNKDIAVSETGWPSGGNTIMDAAASPQNAAVYFLNVVSWARALNVKYFYFEAFDEAWKVRDEGPQGAFWGVMDTSGALKPGMLDVFLGKTVPDNWSNSGQLLPGGQGQPSIQFTYIPPKGSFTELSGQVLHVSPTAYYVAVFIHVNGGWWTKPYLDSPKTAINPDGTWVCDITTGGIDEQADQIAAFLLPTSYNAPLASGDATIPGGVASSSVAEVTVGR